MSRTTWHGCFASTGSASAVGWESCRARSSGSGTWGAPRSPRPSTGTCAPPRITWTGAAWDALKPDLLWCPVLDAGLYVLEKSRRRQAVDDAMVEGHREVHDRANPDHVTHHDRAPADRLGAENRGLGLVDDGLARDRAESAGVVQGEGAAAHVLWPEGLVACTRGEVVDRMRQVDESHQVRILDDGHDQRVRERDRDPHVHVVLEDDPFIRPGRVQVGILQQRLADDLDEERHVGESEPVAVPEPLFLTFAVFEQLGHVDLAQSPCVRRGAHAAHHVLRDLAPNGVDPHDLVASLSR